MRFFRLQVDVRDGQVRLEEVEEEILRPCSGWPPSGSPKTFFLGRFGDLLILGSWPVGDLAIWRLGNQSNGEPKMPNWS